MTTHTNCTHPATKAARAACRKGTTVTEAPVASPLATDYANVDYAFETTECDRCFGSGTPGYLPHYAGVYGGVCFKCNKSGQSKSKGRILTRAGQAAKKAHDEWIAAHLMVPARDLQPGQKFRNLPDGWRTVISIGEPHFAGRMTVGSGDNAVTTDLIHVDITTPNITLSIGADTLVQRTATPAERSALIAAIANRKGTIITPR